MKSLRFGPRLHRFATLPRVHSPAESVHIESSSFNTPRTHMGSCHLTDQDRRVGIVLLTGIGDVVHGLPVANAIKDQDPTREIVWIAEPAPSAILQNHPSVDRIVTFRRRDGLTGVRRLWRDMRGTRADVVLNMQRYIKSVPPMLSFWARKRVGMAPSRTRDGIRVLHTCKTPEGPWAHTQDLFLEFLDVLGVPRPDPLEWRIRFSSEEEERAKAFFDPFDDRPIASLVVGSANADKEWPLELHVPLVEALHREMGFRVMLVGGPDARELERARWIRDQAQVPVEVALEDSVRSLMWKIRGSSLVVSPDSGPLHIARALDVPVVGLYGHTNPARVGPYRRFQDLVIDTFTEPGAVPDPAHYEPKGKRMERITPTDVIHAVGRAVDRYGAGERRTWRPGG